MPLNTFPFEVSYSTQAETTPRIKKLQFTPSVSHRAKDGINNLPLIFNILITRMRMTEARDLTAWMRLQSSYPFYWEAPSPYDVDGPYVWNCDRWSFAWDDAGTQTFSAIFERNFNPIDD
jgi:phage-related protein